MNLDVSKIIEERIADLERTAKTKANEAISRFTSIEPSVRDLVESAYIAGYTTGYSDRGKELFASKKGYDHYPTTAGKESPQ